MKTKMILTVGLICMSAQLFSQNENAKFSLNIGGGADYYLTSPQSKLNSHFGVNGQVEFVILDKFVIGYSQHGSIDKDGLLKVKNNEKDRLGLYEHSAGLGYKLILESGFYVVPKVFAGVGILKTREYFDNDWEELKGELINVKGALFVAPEIKLGYEVNKYLALETHVIYRYYLNSSLPANIQSKDLSGLGMGISIVGRIPF